MVANGANRYAMFTDANESPTTVTSPRIDQSYNAFVNQVGGDGPWQRVTKRGTGVPVQPVVRTLTITGTGAVQSNPTTTNITRDRTFSGSTTSANSYDKSLNQYENWCGVCGRKFPCKATLLNHIKSMPPKTHEHYCNLCKRVFKDRNGIKNHVENAAGHEVFCNMCLSAFKCENGLRDHFRNNKGELHEFSCMGCLTGFFSLQKLVHHNHSPRRHFYNCTATASIPCWGCDALLSSHSALINHLESSRCPGLPDPCQLIDCLGNWWYSALYMDLDIHAQIRTGRIKLQEMRQWMSEGLLHPFLCRGDGCGKTFPHLSSLVLHCESEACNWDIDQLRMTALKKEALGTCVKKASNGST